MNGKEARRSLLALAGWIGLCALLLTGATLLRWQQEAQQQLASQLPKLLSDSLVNAQDPASALQHDWQRLNAEPLRLQATGSLLPVQEATISWSSLGSEPGHGRWPEQLFTWQQDGRNWYGRWQLQLHWAPGQLALLATGLGTLLWLLAWGLPDPRRLRQRDWRRHLMALGLGRRSAGRLLGQIHQQPTLLGDAEALSRSAGRPLDETLSLLEQEAVRQLDPAQRRWLALALQQGLDTSAAQAVARHAPTLSFDLPGSQVLIHGLPVRLSRTPLLYYYWYASRHKAGAPAYINPPSQKPDRREGEALAELMRQHQGHGKAIGDLQLQGLKSKTLDQNRNKIRDELRQVLGELAEPFLFQSQRDPATARYGYSLAIPAEDIVL